MVGVRIAAALLGGWLLAAPGAADISAEQAIELLPLMEDDLCSGAGACAVSALQRRGLALEGVEGEEADEAESLAGTDDATRRRKNQAQDLSTAWMKKLYAWIVFLDQNLTHIEWKMYYFKMDMNSTNNTLFGIPMSKNERYCNGTRVNWNKHPATWLPTFATSEPAAALELPSFGQLAAEANAEARDEAEAESAEAEAEVEAEAVEAAAADSRDAETTGRRRRGTGLKGVPPRKRKIQQLLSQQQTRLNDVWHAVTMYKRRLNWMGNYMGANRRLFHGRPVFMQVTEGRILNGILDKSRWSDDMTWTADEPQTQLVKQIKSGINQTVDLWDQMRLLGGMIQATKRRVHRWNKGTPANLLEAWPEEHSAELLAEEALADAEGPGPASLRQLAEGEWPFFGSTEQCCLCRSGSIGWSASGKCRFCDGAVSKQRSVEAECQIQDMSFKGSQECANSCKTAPELQSKESPAEAA